MELIHRKHKAFAQEDIISNMPDNAATNILDRLPLQDAVRTGILSSKWRFKWTMLSQLVLDDNLLEYLLEKEEEAEYYSEEEEAEYYSEEEWDVALIIYGLLLHLKRAIRKCVLPIDVIDDDSESNSDVANINNFILCSLRDGMEEITLRKSGAFNPLAKLPTHLFFCLGLKHLKLFNCSFHPPTNFHGFPSLLSLELLGVRFESRRFGEFITRCPLLEILKVGYPVKVKVCHITKLANLKTLYLCLGDRENTAITWSSTIFELLGSLPRLQELHLDFQWSMVVKDGAKKRFSTAFSCLKTVKLSGIIFGNLIMMSCVFEIIRLLPNLQTLSITASYPKAGPSPAICSPEVDYSITGSLQLRKAVFIGLKGSEYEIWLIKYLLESFPLLKKIAICLNRSLVFDERVKFCINLLKLQQAYPVVDFKLY